MSRAQPQTSAARKGAPGYFSYSVFAFSLIVGIALGLTVTRLHGPLQRGNAEPWQLHAEDRHHYMIAIALEYAHTGDFPQALNKLIAMRPAKDPLSALADAACALGSRGYLRDQSGINASRSAVALYSSQGRAGCVERLLPLEATAIAPRLADYGAEQMDQPTPPPTKPPLQDEPATRLIHPPPTPPPLRSFEARAARSYCDALNPALIEVHVVDYLGRGIPGQRVRVRWGENEDFFVSGLKSDRGDSYADFQMQEGVAYAIDMPGAAEPLGASLSTGACWVENRRALKSWRVTFVET